MSLRRASLVFGAVLTCVGVGVAVTLIVLSTNLHRAAHELGGGVESLRIGEELEFGLVSVRDAPDPLAREAGEALLRRQVAEAAHYVNGTDEQGVYASLSRLTEAYIEVVDRAANEQMALRERADVRAAFESAFAAVREWILLNVDQSRALRPAVARWDRVANLVGISATSLLVLGLGFLAWWVQRRTFRPALKLVGAIERYAGGEHTVRASEQGPEEFRTIAHRFNDMASTLERQRAGQLAFLAGVAHDLRNPLTALKMALALMPPEQAMPPEPRVRQLLGRVSRQIDRLERMVLDFLDAVRVESGHVELVREDCDLRDLARSTVDLFESASSIHQLALHVPDEPVRLTVDPMRIEQILTNLVGNAIKYSPRGGAIHVTVTPGPDVVLLSVADEGIGISREQIEHLFEPFHRAVLDTAIPGLGLGLFVARRLAEAHGGKLTVDSTPGSGSTFTIHLPRHASTRDTHG